MTNFRKRLLPAYKANRRPLPTFKVETRIHEVDDGWRAVAFDVKLDTKLVDIFIVATPDHAASYAKIRGLLDDALLQLNAKEVRFFPPTPRPD